MENIKIIHDEEGNEFRTEDKNREPAKLKYYKYGEKVDFHNTYVPEEYRGQGVARQLADRGYEWAKRNNFEIEASCTYMQKYLEKK